MGGPNIHDVIRWMTGCPVGEPWPDDAWAMDAGDPPDTTDMLGEIQRRGVELRSMWANGWAPGSGSSWWLRYDGARLRRRSVMGDVRDGEME